ESDDEVAGLRREQPLEHQIERDLRHETLQAPAAAQALVGDLGGTGGRLLGRPVRSWSNERDTEQRASDPRGGVCYARSDYKALFRAAQTRAFRARSRERFAEPFVWSRVPPVHTDASAMTRASCPKKLRSPPPK